MRTDRTRDTGQATLLMMAVIACCGLTAVAVGTLGGALRDRQQAQTAADAAALAGVDGGAPAAAELASANGATLVSFERSPAGGRGWTVSVTVSVGAATARARASSGP